MLIKLIHAHPLLFPASRPPRHSTLPDGWFAIAHALCCAIEAQLTSAELTACGVARVSAVQGRLEVAMMGAYPDAIDGLIESAVLLSEVTCQECGERPASFRANGVNLTLCGFCEHERCIRAARNARPPAC